MTDIQRKERPIIFSGSSVRSILADLKRATRRIVKPAPVAVDAPPPAIAGGHWEWKGKSLAGQRAEFLAQCPYGQPGDRLWVRENTERYLAQSPSGAVALSRYSADREPVMSEMEVSGSLLEVVDHWWYPRATRPAIHMPRNQCRIVLEITAVRVERLHAITNEQCIAEGCRGGHGSIPGYIYNATPQEHFRHIWESVGGDYFSNPWVWVIEFRRIQP